MTDQTLPEPQAGGSYRRNPDGSLELVERTLQPGEEPGTQPAPDQPGPPADAGA
jgi:hypothetical protein